MPDDKEAPGGAAAPPPGAGLGLGERLRSARKARALSVAQAAAALHLEEESLMALEEERFAVLGAPVFVRGHLRRYAQLLGLSEEPLLAAYRDAVPEAESLPALTRPRVAGEGVRAGTWVWWVLALLVLMAGLYALTAGNKPAPPAPTPPTVPVVPPPAPAPAARLPSPASPPLIESVRDGIVPPAAAGE